mmetsp:Transcript_31148/g.31664  ORF Transcript_31148/g.31664 Transcript_31148/m.31664 type:complete len:83 (+) Transcript_31148:70-318(+)
MIVLMHCSCTRRVLLPNPPANLRPGGEGGLNGKFSGFTFGGGVCGVKPACLNRCHRLITTTHRSHQRDIIHSSMTTLYQQQE